MKSFKIILLTVFSISSLISCDNNEFQEPAFQVAADIYVRTVKIGDEVVHAPVIYAYSNKALFSTTVNLKGETDPRYDLDDTFEGVNRLRSIPSTSDFKSTDVENGVYEFKITSSGNEVLKVKDELLNKRMEVMNITEFNFDKDTHLLDITWDRIANANFYVVKLMSAKDKNHIFVSEGLTKNNYTFKPGGKGWSYSVMPKKGSTYTIAVCAYLLEIDNNKQGGINHETIEYKEIVW